ncbi:MAG TPA: M48 family metallopeptidase [Bacteroidales bacterium]|nr:M48 family metallopeptidase [Bacteroidales bacterium]HCI54638.1 peptidase M48 [Bacteroidales bacterium]HOU95632.1 M48 family metallopeptidase [Bacteroidales bacterium]HQG52805.1 M48 family metallopeptidase [Bacteroidales bacterium]HRC89397.1 M48 family metallopeptidase [Bacteroidales bacterium]
MQNTIYILLMLIPLAGYITESYLSYLNMKMWSPEVPLQLKGICDEKEYRKIQFYNRDSSKLSFWSSTLNIILLLVMIATGGFALLDRFVRIITVQPVYMSLFFFGILGLALDIINMPFNWYDNFVIEKKYGLNTMSYKTFINDHLKSWLLALLIGAPVLALITWVYYKTGKMFWIYAWILITIFTIFINLFYSELIVPLFNKQTPLESGSLRDKIENFANKTGFKLKNIYVIDGSKRSTRANAYFSGLGSRIRIVLYDTLIKELTEEEIVAVLAHEIGHYRKKHVLWSIIISIIVTGLMLFLFSFVVDNPQFSKALRVEDANFHIGLVVFGILYSPLALVIGLFSNYISRKSEYEADRFVKENYDGKILASALKKLSLKNLDNMVTHPLYVFFHYSHPPLLNRLERVE